MTENFKITIVYDIDAGFKLKRVSVFRLKVLCKHCLKN